MALKNVPFGELDAFNVIIEVPTGSQKKYSYDHLLDVIKLTRVLYNEVVFPFNYGFVAHTESDDGEGLDAFVLCTHPLTQGTMVTCRAVGMIEVIDRGKADHKIIAVSNNDFKWNHIQNMGDLPVEYIRMFEEFYQELAKQWKHELVIKGFHDKTRAIKELLRTQVID